jgi:hypothetical protein
VGRAFAGLLECSSSEAQRPYGSANTDGVIVGRAEELEASGRPEDSHVDQPDASASPVRGSSSSQNSSSWSRRRSKAEPINFDGVWYNLAWKISFV